MADPMLETMRSRYVRGATPGVRANRAHDFDAFMAQYVLKPTPEALAQALHPTSTVWLTQDAWEAFYGGIAQDTWPEDPERQAIYLKYETAAGERARKVLIEEATKILTALEALNG